MTMINMGAFSTVNGVQEYTTSNKLTANGSATDESILIYSNGTIQVDPSSAITVDFLRCNLFIKDPIPASQWYNINDASISYNSATSDRYSTGSQINFEDCQIVFNASSIRAIFLSNCTSTRVFNAGSTMLTYTQAGANLNNMHLENSNWEVNGQPSEASNIKLVNSGITNFLVPRLDFAYIDLATTGNNLTLNIGNGGNVSVYMWNFVQFDNTKINHQHVNNRYYDGVSASWKFKDRDNGTDVNDVLVINSSDKSGLMTELGRFTTDANGVLAGTYDSRFETTGASQVRDTLFLYENYSDQSGSSYSNGGLSYDIVSVENRIEVRSYLHEAPVGYIVGDTYTGGKQGSINPTFSADAYQSFILNNDLNITETNKATVLAYTDLENTNKLYDRHKAEWRDNDNYPLAIKSGIEIDIDSYDIVIDATAPQAYSFSGNTIIIKASVFIGNITTTGTLNFINGASGVGKFTSSSGVQISISLTFNNLNASTVEIFDNTGASVQRYTSQTGTLVYSTPLGSTGSWSYIIDRVGYAPIISNFNPTLNDLIIDGAQALLITAQGNQMYSGSSSALVNITYDFAVPQLSIDIGNGGVSPQVIFDEVEKSLITANGMRWQKENNTLVRFDDLPAVGQVLFMQDNIRLIRASAGDVNAAINGYVLSTQSIPVDGVNGNVNYVASPDYATPVWNALLTSHNVSSSFGALLQLLETKTQADSRQAILVGEHNDTQADIAALPSVGNIADGVWDEPYNQHTTAGTFGKLMDILRKANRSIEGEVTGTPTTTSFTTNIAGYVTGAFDSEVMVFVSGSINGEAKPILSFNATNGTFDFEEAWTQAPSTSDEFIILPYHVHAISEIQAGLAKTTELNTVETNLLAQHTATQNLINALNNLSEAQVKSQADQALTDYDAPTKAELDSVETAILGAISGLNNLTQQEVAEAVWDYLQSTSTVSASMKEAILKTLVNANLIPAAI